MPKVSVIIPVYGVEQYIERCARSLFEQTLEDIEFIFVDDCTPDKSIEILKNVLEDYPQRKNQVKIERHEKNMGLPIARQSGLKVASGDYIIHCDSDDWVDVTMYEKMYNKAIEEGSDVVVCDYMVTDGESTQNIVKACHSEKPFEFLENMLFQRDPWSLWNKLFKKTAYSKDLIYPKGNMGEDMILCLQLIRNSTKITYINESLYYYFFNINSITKSRSRKKIINKFEQSVSNASVLLEICKKWNIYDKYRDAINSILLNNKNLIRPLIGETKYYVIWKNTFPEINIKILFNKNVSIKYKIKHILTLLRLYRGE